MSGQRITVAPFVLALLVCGLWGQAHPSFAQQPDGRRIPRGQTAPSKAHAGGRTNLGFVPAHEKVRGALSSRTRSAGMNGANGSTGTLVNGTAIPDSSTAQGRQHALSRGIDLRLDEPMQNQPTQLQQTGPHAAQNQVAQANYVVPELAAGEMVVDSGLGMPMLGGWGMSSPTCFAISGEYLYWQTRGMDIPALVTTSPAGTAQEDAGVLSRPGTEVLFGNSAINNDDRSGYRINFGIYTDPAQTYGISFIYTDLSEASDRFQQSATNTILARPFFNTVENDQDSRLLSFPDLVSGSVDIDTSTDFNALEALVAVGCWQLCENQVAFFIGYRYASLEDMIRIQETTRSLSGVTSGTTFDLFDQFDTENEFHGGELAMRYRTSGYWGTSLEVLTRAALGSTHSTTALSAQTRTTATTGSNTTERGLLVQSSNVGTFSDDNLSTIAELGFTLRRDLGYGLVVRAGYSLLYWSDVMRAGDQIDLTINPTQIPPGSLTGAARPALPNDVTSFWAQGLHAGFEFPF